MNVLGFIIGTITFWLIGTITIGGWNAVMMWYFYNIITTLQGIEKRRYKK